MCPSFHHGPPHPQWESPQVSLRVCEHTSSTHPPTLPIHSLFTLPPPTTPTTSLCMDYSPDPSYTHVIISRSSIHNSSGSTRHSTLPLHLSHPTFLLMYPHFHLSLLLPLPSLSPASPLPLLTSSAEEDATSKEHIVHTSHASGLPTKHLDA